MGRAARIIVLTLALGCKARVLGVAGASVPEFDAPPALIRHSDEPFVENPRFCGAIGNACAVVPTPC